MAETLDLNVNVNTNGVDNSVGSLKKQLREAQADVVVLSDKFGATSVQAIEAAKKVAVLKDKIGDAKALADAFNPDAKFKALTASLAGAAGGFGALQGAMALFGAESDDVQKALLKVQSAMALSQGLQAVGESIDSFKTLGAVIKSSETFQKLNTTTTAAAAVVQRLFTGAVNETTVSFKFLKVAIAATGIGLFLVALGTLIAYWDDIKGAIGGVNVEQGKLNVQSTKNLKTEQDKLEAIDGQNNQLKLQGKSEREILAIKMKQTEEAIKAATINVENAKITKKLQVEASERNKEILTGIVKFMAIPITLLLTTIDEIGNALGKNYQLLKGFTGGLSNFVFNPKKTAEEGDKTIKEAEKTLSILKEKDAGYKLTINELNKKDADEKQKLADSFAAFTLNAKLQQQADDRAFIEDGKKLQADADAADAEKAKLEEEDRIAGEQYIFDRSLKINKIKKDADDVALANKKENDNAVLEAQFKLEDAKFSAVSAGLGMLESLAGKNEALANTIFIIDKAMAIAKIVVDTQREIAGYYSNPTWSALPDGGLTLKTAASTGAKIRAGVSIATIAATSIAKFKGGGSGAGLGGASAGMPSMSFGAPMTPQLPNATTTNLSQQSINDIGNQAVRAYVIESDVTSNQQRITAIRQRARFS
jgi:hypothetical protein